MNSGLEIVAIYLSKAFGFEIKQQGPSKIRADDPTRKFMALTIIEDSNVLNFYSCYITGPCVSRHPEAYTMFMCDLNRQSRITKYYADDDHDLVMKAVLPTPVSPESFAAFMTHWESDLGDLHRGELSELLGKFISST